MISTLPGTGEPFLREYLFVDGDRVRSLLAQLAEGAPEQYKASEAQHRAWQLNVRMPVGGNRNNVDVAASEETRSLTDLHLAMLEDVAEPAGFLRDMSDELKKAKEWKRSRHLRKLKPGDLIRVTAPTRVSDPRHIGDLVRRFGGVVPDADQRGIAEVGRFASLMDVMWPSGVVVRSFPAGVDEPECNLVGILPESSAYISGERNALFSRFGYEAQEWTLLGLVARVPDEPQPVLRPPASISELLTGESIDRLELEMIAASLAGYLETYGIAEAPKFPAIAVTPLALYRMIQAYS